MEAISNVTSNYPIATSWRFYGLKIISILYILYLGRENQQPKFSTLIF